MTFHRGHASGYPARQMFTSRFTTVAKLQLGSSNENNFMLGSAQRELYEGVAALGRLRGTAIRGCDSIHSSPGARDG